MPEGLGVFKTITVKDDYMVVLGRDWIEKPTLYAITDSLAAFSWFDQAYPDPFLFGRSHAERAGVWSATRNLPIRCVAV